MHDYSVGDAQYIDLYVSTYAKKVYRGGWSQVYPIEVGAKNRDALHGLIYSTTDSVADNISSVNPWFGELTGLYWVWKNTRSKIIGFFHYNKYLDITEDDAILALKQYDAIVARHGRFINHIFPDEYQLFLNILKDYDNRYFEVYQSIVEPGGAGIFNGQNMLIMKREVFEEYCKFLFPLLFKVHEKIGSGHDSPNDKRYCAFFAERILTPWLTYRGYTYIEAPIRMMGPWYYRILVRIRFSRLYRLLPDIIKIVLNKAVRRSSYGA